MVNLRYKQEFTMSKKRTEYSATFKAEALAKVKENNDNLSLTAKEFGIPSSEPQCQIIINKIG